MPATHRAAQDRTAVNPAPITPLVVIEAALAPHVLDLLDTAGIAGSASPVADRTDLVSIAVAPTQVERARATLDLVLPGLLDEPASSLEQDPARPLSGRLIRRSDWASDAEDDGTAPPGPPPAPRLLDGRSAFAAAVSGGAAPSRDTPTGDEDDFVPLEPPPIPRGDTVSRFAWLGAVGGPVLMVLTALLGLPSAVAAIGLAGFVVGFGVLVARMPDRGRQDDGWDDGAVL
jgi:hypothetical protein